MMKLLCSLTCLRLATLCVLFALAVSAQGSVRGSIKLQQTRELNGNDCEVCWPGTAGPCKSAFGVCCAYTPGTTDCPPGATKCPSLAPEEPGQKKNLEVHEQKENAEDGQGATEEGLQGEFKPQVACAVGDPHL